MTRAALTLGLLLLVATPVAAKDALRAVGAPPVKVRAAWKLDPWYQKHVEVAGFPIVGSKKVTDHALREAAWIIEHMLGKRPDVLAALVKAKVRCCVMAHDEVTTDVPEHMTLEPGKWWDKRARGLGASKERPCISCAEENLLGYPGDPYRNESILVHEFAHAIDLMALRTLDKQFESKLDAAFRAAMKQGLWKGLYAASNKEEYWAEGVQSWFDTNRPPDVEHNHVDTRAELEAYDPRLAKLIAEAFGGIAWRYVPPSKRKTQGHIAGYDASKAPRFAWPKGLEAWFRRYEARERQGAGRVELQALPAGSAPLHSRTSRHETSILFVNETGGTVELMWIDPQGGRRSYATLNAGAHTQRHTFSTHVWVVVDAQGKDIARFVATVKPGRARIQGP